MMWYAMGVDEDRKIAYEIAITHPIPPVFQVWQCGSNKYTPACALPVRTKAQACKRLRDM